MTDNHPVIDPLAPWPTLVERDAGALPVAEHFEGVEPHLEPHLRTWVSGALFEQDDLVRRVLARLRVSWTLRVPTGRGGSQLASPRTVLVRLAAGEVDQIQPLRPVDQLTVVDAIIGLHPDWDAEPDWNDRDPQHAWLTRLADLHGLLKDAGSAWRVDREFRGLYRRVDAPVVEAWQKARQLAEDAGRTSASRFLTEAWKKVYGQHPEPTDGYTAAVKAVEAAVVPAVLPHKSRAIVHHVRAELQKHADKWQFVLAEDETTQAGAGSVDVVVTMLDRLLRGETERHGVEGQNRPSTLAEAQAAVHLAAVLVQWFVSGAVQPRP